MDVELRSKKVCHKKSAETIVENFFFRRVEQFMVFRIPKLGIDNSQNVLIRKVWTYSKGKLKRDDLFIIEKGEKETEYGTFRRNLRQRKS